MSKKTLTDIMNMSNEEAIEEGRKFVYIATKKGGCDVIRSALKCLGEKVRVSESGKVLVNAKVIEGGTVTYPIYIQYNHESGMWEGNAEKPNVSEDYFYTDNQLGRLVLLASAMVHPMETLAALLGC